MAQSWTGSRPRAALQNLRPLVVLSDVGERSDLDAGDVGVLVQNVDVVMRRDADDRHLGGNVALIAAVGAFLGHDGKRRLGKQSKCWDQSGPIQVWTWTWTRCWTLRSADWLLSV